MTNTQLSANKLGVLVETRPEREEYNPWQNERFLEKAGNLKDKHDRLSYVPCYRDTDPNYYDDDTN